MRDSLLIASVAAMRRCQAAVFTERRPSVTATARAGAVTCSASKGNFEAKSLRLTSETVLAFEADL
jgi:hypothetical protein